jgi:hypothetical protein
MISEHASPLAGLGGVDGGGQNVYVAQVARHLTRRGHQVEVLTRRDRPDLPSVLTWLDGVRVVHITAGPPARRPKEQLLPFMEEFTHQTLRRARHMGYDLVHANFFMSALVGAQLKTIMGLPLVVTFHALGRVRRLHQGVRIRSRRSGSALRTALLPWHIVSSPNVRRTARICCNFTAFRAAASAFSLAVSIPKSLSQPTKRNRGSP